jgi:uncharacterized GH25 family protein
MECEIVPISSPFAAKTGTDFVIQLITDGKPLANASVGLLVEPKEERVFATTDAKGKATFSLRRAVRAMIFAVHLRPAHTSEQWRSDFTTVTFQIKGPK